MHNMQAYNDEKTGGEINKLQPIMPQAYTNYLGKQCKIQEKILSTDVYNILPVLL